MAKKSKEVELQPESKEIIDKILDESKNEIVDKVIIEVRRELKEEKELIKKDLLVEVKDLVKKDQDKIIRGKSFQIFRLKICILLLIGVICFLTYRLYDTGNIEFLNKKEDNHVSEKKQNKKTKEDTKDLDWYKEKYSYLLDNIKVTNKDVFNNSKVSDYSMSDKLVMAYLNLDSNKINKEDTVYQVSKKDLENSYLDLFGTKDFKDSSFKVNGLKYAYLNITDSYIAISDGEVDNDIIFKNEIYNIVEKDKDIEIYTYIYSVIDDNIYNISDLDNSLGKSINEVSNKLNKVKYVFSLDSNKYYISSIEYVNE